MTITSTTFKNVVSYEVRSSASDKKQANQNRVAE